MERSRTSTRARRAPWLVLLAAAMVLAACGTETTDTAESAEDAESADDTDATAEGTDDGVPLVVVSTNILGDIVENVAGDEATVEVLMPLGANPHSYEPSAQEAALMRDADLVVANGLGLEEGLLTAIEAAQEDGVRVLEVGPSLDPAPFVGAGGDDGHDHGDEEHDHGDEDHGDEDHGDEDHGDEEHDHGDEDHGEEDHGDEEHDHGDEDHGDEEHDHGDEDHAHDHEGGLDAHVWMDPVRMAEAVDLIATELDEVADGDFLARGASYRAELETLDAEIEAMLATVPEADRKLVTNHFAYGYYADRYGLEMLGTVIPAATTEAQASAAEFAELVEIIEESGVSAIFASTTESTTLAEVIADEVGRDVEVLSLYTGSLGEEGSGAETYIGMMMTSTERIVEGLTT